MKVRLIAHFASAVMACPQQSIASVGSSLRQRALLASLLTVTLTATAQTVEITVDVTQGRRPVSPYLYGKNDWLGNPDSPRSEADWQRMRDAGVRMVRGFGGNNGTKYNWQKRLTSHPDWYNNVYDSDWDYAQTQLQQHLPGVQSLWCLPLIGTVANTSDHNFNDWGFNGSQWWSGVHQNLAGGGVVSGAGGGEALLEGDPALYLTDTTPQTVTGILEHWMKADGLGLDRRQFLYWSMDNEPEIWEGTHDDVMPKQLPAEEFMQRYFAYAKAARARFPEIKLTGPVPANEWQWYNWSGGIRADGRNYPWLEYFIKRVAEEQRRTGIRLLDVLDIHYYPQTSVPAEVVQLHRTFFDRTYSHPEDNGVKAVNGGWDPSITQEYIFGRCQDWLDHYAGPDHGVTLAVTETDAPVANAPLVAIWYASMLGEFMRHGVEIFTPWSWQPGMWEVLHLFSRYNGDMTVQALSSDDALVSAYATTARATGDLTIVLVNRALSVPTTASINLSQVSLPDGSYSALQLADLPPTETFVSHAHNALQTRRVNLSDNRFDVTLPPLSITSVRFEKAVAVVPPPGPSRLANVSVRATSGTDADGLIVGLVVGGAGTKEVLLRGIGPSLAAFGVTSALPDPVMTVTNDEMGTIGTNDNWGSGAEKLVPLSQELGAFPLSEESLDTALAVALPPGGFSVRIVDRGDAVGIALGEAYDADLWGPSRLVNVSARTRVGQGEESLIAGFVITGGSPRKVLIRAVGPGLSEFGVPGVLSNPVLRVFKQGNDLPIYRNERWGEIAYADSITATAEACGAFGLEASSNDAVLLLELPPGAYTAVVTGKNDTTGIALVEVYEVP